MVSFFGYFSRVPMAVYVNTESTTALLGRVNTRVFYSPHILCCDTLPMYWYVILPEVIVAILQYPNLTNISRDDRKQYSAQYPGVAEYDLSSVPEFLGTSNTIFQNLGNTLPNTPLEMYVQEASPLERQPLLWVKAEFSFTLWATNDANIHI